MLQREEHISFGMLTELLKEQEKVLTLTGVAESMQGIRKPRTLILRLIEDQIAVTHSVVEKKLFTINTLKLKPLTVA